MRGAIACPRGLKPALYVVLACLTLASAAQAAEPTLLDAAERGDRAAVGGAGLILVAGALVLARRR